MKKYFEYTSTVLMSKFEAENIWYNVVYYVFILLHFALMKR